MKIEQKKILVIGDIMIDQYEFGTVNRISPEAPVPVFLKEKNNYVLGGAGNVVANLRAARQNVSVCSVMGDDEAADRIEEMLCSIGADCRFLFRKGDRCTTRKIRIVGQNNNQLLRIDEETTDWISKEDCDEFLQVLRESMVSFDAVLLSDYCKGVLSEEFCQGVIRLASESNIPVFIDVKDTNLKKYNNAYLLKPNRLELKTLTGMPVKTLEDVRVASEHLLQMTGCSYVLTTLGGEGMYLVTKDHEYSSIPAEEKEVFDVSGAGDTSISYLVVGMVSGCSIEESIHLANVAAGIKITKVGTSPVFLHEVYSELSFQKGRMRVNQKIVDLDDIDMLQVVRKNKKLIFTNGCFDIMHIGHVTYLREAAALCDLLVIGLNNDASVKRLKGEERPITSQSDRAEMLAALEFVDYVIIFDEDTPKELIEMVKPDVLVKGGDYKEDEIVGADFVKANGGRVITIPLVEGKSTTNIINAIKKKMIQ